MALVLYSQYLTFPGGAPAANYAVSVRLRASNQQAPIFTDQAGTAPAPNPYTTDGFGFISFYAAPGDYEVPLAGEFQRVPLDASVTDPVWPDLVVHEQGSAATVWSIMHGFGGRPAVDVVADDAELVAQVGYPDGMNVTVTFGTSTAGTAYLRR